MNIKKVRKLFRDPKLFLSDSIHYNKLFHKKNSHTLGFIIIGNDNELIKLTLDSLKQASNLIRKKTLTYKVIPFDNHVIIDNNENYNLNYHINELNSDFVKIIFQGEKINNDFIKEFHRNEKINKKTNIIITPNSTESNKIKIDPLFSNLKIKGGHGDLNNTNHTILIPLFSNLIFNSNLFKSDIFDGIENNIQWNIMCCIKVISTIQNDLSYVYIRNAVTFPLEDSSLESTINNLTKNESLILPILISLKKYLHSNSVGIVTKRSIFYFTHCIVLSFLKNKKAEEILSFEAKDEIYKTIVGIVASIGIEVIKSVASSNYNHIHKAGYYGLLNEKLPFNMCYIEDTDVVGKKIKIKIASQEKFTPLVSLNKKNRIPLSLKARVYSLLGHIFSNEIYLWIPFENTNQKVLILGERKNDFLYAGKRVDGVTINQAITSIKNKNKVAISLPLKVRLLRKIAKNKLIAQVFSKAWLLTDNEVRADDNAEHFYRYIQSNHKNINAYFILNKNSCDWSRLKSQGFKLIKFGGLFHRLALLNATMLLSSHANPAIINFLPRKHFSDMLNYKFVFLQHGITKDDQSEWLNSRKIDYLVTAAQHEYADIAENGRYRYTSVETVLTGFPRYDNLVQPEYDHKKILILPTWRKSLAGELLSKTSKRVKNKLFNQSEFCKQWSQFLNSEELDKLSRKYGYSILFYPHPNLVDYLDDMKIPSHIEIGTFGSESFQEVFKKASVLITDFSSVAFDVAYMSKPIIYFQFDIDTFFSEHSYSKGYYEYDELGFGPVVHDIESLNTELQICLENNCVLQEKYNERINTFFPFSDYGNSERLFNILTSPKSTKPCLHTILTYIQYYNNINKPVEVANLLNKHSEAIISSTEFYHNRIKNILNEIRLTSFIYEKDNLLSTINFISDSIISRKSSGQLITNKEFIDCNIENYINAILNAETGEVISCSPDYYHEKTPPISMANNYLLMLINYQKDNFSECIHIYNQYFNGPIKLQPRKIVLLHIHALIMTSNIIDACNKLKSLSLSSEEKQHILFLLYENYKVNHIGALSIPFLKPDISFSTKAINTYFYLSVSIKPEDSIIFFRSGIYSDVLINNFLSKMYEKNNYSDIILFLSKNIIFDTFVTTNNYKRIYLFSLFKIDGLEAFIKEALRLTNTKYFVKAIDAIFLDEIKATDSEVLYNILEEIVKSDTFSFSCAEIYKYVLILYKNNRPGLAKKIITLYLIRQHEEHYVDSNSWSGVNDYKSLISATKEMEQILS